MQHDAPSGSSHWVLGDPHIYIRYVRNAFVRIGNGHFVMSHTYRVLKSVSCKTGREIWQHWLEITDEDYCGHDIEISFEEPIINNGIYRLRPCWDYCRDDNQHELEGFRAEFVGKSLRRLRVALKNENK